MKHIRQINSVGTNTYTIIITDDWILTLEEHPSIINHGDLFEIADCDTPKDCQYLIYENF